MASRPVKQARRRREQGGFTMIELLITLVVTVFGLMGAMALHASLARGNETAGRTNEATAIGMQVLEELRGQRAADMMTKLGASAPPADVVPYTTVLGRNGMSYTIDVHLAEVSGQPSLWRIRVEVKWTDDTTGSTSTVEQMIPFEVVRTMQEAL